MIEILYSDDQITVCLKPVGVLSQDGGGESLPQMLKRQLQVEEVYPVHRLDKAVGGVMVYALTRNAAAELSRAVQERTLEKMYLAVVRGPVEEQEGDLEDLLFHDKMKNKTYVVKRLRKGVKPAKLSYRVLKCAGGYCLVRVRLHTGRTHQIRVQFASRRHPLAGDGRYGGKAEASELGLWSCGLSFHHPVSGEPMRFYHDPPHTALWSQFSAEITIEKESCL